LFCDGKESAREIFKPGKNCDGYFTNEEIMEQAEKAMEILARDYPDEDHILIYDNATTPDPFPDKKLCFKAWRPAQFRTRLGSKAGKATDKTW
jgi:hypothetical protein